MAWDGSTCPAPLMINKQPGSIWNPMLPYGTGFFPSAVVTAEGERISADQPNVITASGADACREDVPLRLWSFTLLSFSG